jgi:hypothetical protein
MLARVTNEAKRWLGYIYGNLRHSSQLYPATKPTTTVHRFPEYIDAWYPSPMRTLKRTIYLFLLSAPLVLGGCSSGDDDGPAPAPDADGTLPDALPAAVLEYMDTCDVADDQCDTASDLLCFGFNNNGPHCTHACEVAEDCEAPSRGCGGMGVCSPP